MDQKHFEDGITNISFVEGESEVDQSKMLMFRTPMEDKNQIVMVNAPFDHNDKRLIVYQYPGILNSLPGYCAVFKCDHYIVSNPPNYRSPRKRSNLNECIRQLYHMSGMARTLHWAPGTIVESPEALWKQVNFCLTPERLSSETESLQKVKRQLFREARGNRKGSYPKRSCLWGDTCTKYFKPIRKQIIRPLIRLDYFKDARRNALKQLIHENLEREQMQTRDLCQKVISVVGALNTALTDNPPPGKRPNTLNMQNQLRDTIHNHNVIVEQSVRSIFYAKQLFRLIDKQAFLRYEDEC